MRWYLVALSALMILLGGSSLVQAKVAIAVDKDAQQMTVAVDGVERYRWPVSTGNPSHETPNGSFRAFRMEEDHYSKEFDDAPMPHSIFFTKVGHAIHGTDSVGRLGTPASHGCVRLSRANASTLYALVQSEGVLNTTVSLTGSAQVALARNPKPKANTAVARRAPDYDGVGAPVELAPQPAPRRIVPQVADDGYITPADGSSDQARYPAPRGYRRYDDAQAAPQPQTQYYGARVYAPRQYYQPRGYYGYYD
ncbi:L,D-transpeptidase [Rhodopseudomonas palustris]|uniref:ErfK/YbiS/YcfS/YnhG n=1 Tax=Rhodopseudomonas palustris (strain BisB18) TaxID=316056 RepID=Q211V8_RHOPB